MPRTYRRKTSWGSTPLEEIERAASEVKGGKSIRSVAKERQIDRSTLRRYIKRGTHRRVFSEEVEKELAEHIKKLAEQFHGISPKKCRELALELAGRNNIVGNKPRQKLQESSSEESDVPIPFEDTSEYESSSDERSEPDVSDLVVGDFVIVRFASKSRSHHYIGLVDSFADNEVSARFLRRIRGITSSKKPTFVFKENDEASFPRKDVLKKLPQPQQAG
uniref:HTH psq-type domain-containing protein n=1 Tax=Oreochromis aureus TaxID=47969 RepID=A0AAZ1XKP8_OREAU